MRVQADDPRTRLLRELHELVDLEQRHAELRVRAGGAHVLVVAAALARVDADEQVAALESLRPVTQRIEIIERDPNALLERALVFLPRREVRREQNSAAVDLRQQV